MTASRKLSVFALLAAVALLPSVASASTVTCDVSATAPQIRAEGITEIVGDVTISCTGSDNVAALNTASNTVESFLVNVTATYNTNVTNPENADDGVTNAVLVLGGGDMDLTALVENDCTTPADAGDGSACANSTATVPDPQYGVRNGDVSLKWEGVRLALPSGDSGGDGTADNWTESTMRITGVRVNASMLGIPASTGTAGSDIEVDIAILAFPTGDNSLVVTNNSDVVVGSSLLGLAMSNTADTETDGLQCADETAANSLTSVIITEGFPTAFKDDSAVDEGITNQVLVENGHSEDNMAGVGGASQATQIVLHFSGVPDGVEVGVLATPDCEDDDVITDGEGENDDSDTLVLTAWTCDSAGVPDAVGAVVDDDDSVLDSTHVAVPITDGSGQICYDVSTNSNVLSEDCHITVVSGWTADTANDSPIRGTYSVAASYGPLSTVTEGDDDTALVPRFLDGTATDAWAFGTVNSCDSTILFPFVTNQSGYDTGLVVANTSMDGDGDGVDQAGTCSIAYYGETTGGGDAPDADTTDSIAAGDQLIWLLSSGNSDQGVAAAADFQGYVIATCDFNWGHGYAFITDGFGGVPTLAQGYLGLVINTRAAATVETLGQ